MIEAEFIELIFMAATIQEQYALDFLSMVFAYVVAGHFVGASLTRVQFVVLTAIYSGFTIAIGFGALLGVRQLGSLSSRFLEEHPAGATTIVPSDAPSFVPPILLSSAWLISVWYVASVRRARRP